MFFVIGRGRARRLLLIGVICQDTIPAAPVVRSSPHHAAGKPSSDYIMYRNCPPVTTSIRKSQDIARSFHNQNARTWHQPATKCHIVWNWGDGGQNHALSTRCGAPEKSGHNSSAGNAWLSFCLEKE